MSKDPGWKLKMSYPHGWIQLPTGGRDKPERWAEGVARETLGAQGSAERVSARVSDLTRLTYGARARNDWYGLAYYPSFAPTLVALLDIKAYVPGREYKTMTLEVLEEIFGGPSSDTVGDAAVEREQLPGGQAVRVRRMRVEEGDPTGQGTIIEGVTHAIKPPGIDGAVEVSMTWTVLQLGDKLAEMADMIARTIRVTSAR
jgi:hypothetical protein